MNPITELVIRMVLIALVAEAAAWLERRWRR